MTSAYCTVLSKGRLYQAVALFKSLEQVDQDSPIFILCMDEDTHRVLQAEDEAAEPCAGGKLLKMNCY